VCTREHTSRRDAQHEESTTGAGVEVVEDAPVLELAATNLLTAMGTN